MIITAMPGVGKSSLGKNHPDIVKDLESSLYKWIFDEVAQGHSEEWRKGRPAHRRPNPEWPTNYINAIRSAQVEYPIVTISRDLEVREALAELGIPYTTAYPSHECKAEYIARLISRGNCQAYVANVERHFDGWVDECEQESGFHIKLQPGEYLETKLFTDVLGDNS